MTVPIHLPSEYEYNEFVKDIKMLRNRNLLYSSSEYKR